MDPTTTKTTNSAKRQTAATVNGPSSTRTTKKLNYLEIESDYLGDISYDIEVSVPLPDFKHLAYPLSQEVFCGYRPTPIEFQFLQIVTSTECGPSVDLIDPVSAYPVKVPPSPAPEDAALLVGLIPGVERHLKQSEFLVNEPQKPLNSEEPKISNKKEIHSSNDVVDLINEQFKDNRIYIHPTKPQLTPVRIFEFLPHPRLWANEYIHAAAQQVDTLSEHHPLLFKSIENLSTRLKNFALFEPQSYRDAHQQKLSNDDQTFLETSYQFLRDYVVRFPEDNVQINSLIIDVPKEMINDKQAVYYIPTKGPKLLFTKSSTSQDGKKNRSGFRVKCRPPTTNEIKDEITRFRALRDISVLTIPQITKSQESDQSDEDMKIKISVASSAARTAESKKVDHNTKNLRPPPTRLRKSKQQQQQSSSSGESSSVESSSQGDSADSSDDDSSDVSTDGSDDASGSSDAS